MARSRMLTAVTVVSVVALVHAQAPTFDGKWATAPALPEPISDCSATTYKDAIFVFGGCVGNQVYRKTPFEGYYCEEISDRLHMHVIDSKGFIEGVAAPRRRYRHTAASYFDSMFVFGGRNMSDGLISAVDVFNFDKDRWTTLDDPMPVPRSDLTSVYLNGYIHVIGGFDADYTALTSVSSFDPRTRQWAAAIVVPDLTIARGDVSAAVVAGRIYVVGGFTHENNFDEPLPDVEEFDPLLGQWVPIQPLTVHRGDKVALSLNGRLHVIGGQQSSGAGAPVPVVDVEIYDGDTRDWHDESQTIDQARFRFCGATYRNRAYVFGGQTERIGGFNEPESFYPATAQVEIFEEQHKSTVDNNRVDSDTIIALVAVLIVIVLGLVATTILILVKLRTALSRPQFNGGQGIANPSFNELETNNAGVQLQEVTSPGANAAEPGAPAEGDMGASPDETSEA